jgi:hypothetical protein
MGELVEIRLVLPWQAEGLLCQTILLFLPCQEPTGITEASILRHSTAGWGFPVAAHRSRTFSPSWTTIGLEGCGPPEPGSNNVNYHVRNANALVQMLVIQLVNKSAVSTWPVVHYGVHKIEPFFAVVNLLKPVFTFAPCIFTTEVHKFKKKCVSRLRVMGDRRVTWIRRYCTQYSCLRDMPPANEFCIPGLRSVSFLHSRTSCAWNFSGFPIHTLCEFLVLAYRLHPIPMS